jgi:hypothetical protein
MSEPREEDEIEMTDNEVGEYDQDITSPFSVNDIKVTHATVMLPTIINRLKRKEIGIPDYQRQADLWSNNQKSRLIESILLKLPLPVFYFDVSDPEKWMVIDGLQRISTIKSFFVKQTLKLKGLEFLIELNGKKCDDLPTNLQRRLIMVGSITVACVTFISLTEKGLVMSWSYSPTSLSVIWSF